MNLWIVIIQDLSTCDSGHTCWFWVLNVMSCEVIVQYLMRRTLYIVYTEEWVTIASNNDVYYFNGSERFSSLIIVIARLEYPIKFVTVSFRMKNRLIIIWIVWRYLASITQWSNCMTLSHTTIIRMQWSIEIKLRNGKHFTSFWIY